MRAHPDVTAACALLVGRELCGFYAPAGVPAAAVSAAVARRLPCYAVPTRLFALDALPLTRCVRVRVCVRARVCACVRVWVVGLMHMLRQERQDGQAGAPAARGRVRRRSDGWLADGAGLTSSRTHGLARTSSCVRMCVCALDLYCYDTTAPD